MFKARETIGGSEFGAGCGPAATAAALTHAQLLADPATPLRQRVAAPIVALRNRIESRCAAIDLVPDLAEDIGSARWFRGLGTMVGLTVLALAFWPDFSAVEAAPAMPVSVAERDEFRSQMIMPLALGADSGRRMAPGAAVVPIANAPERPMVQLVATLGQGDSFGRMLQRAGVGAADAARVTEMVAQVMPLGKIEPGTRFAITLGQSGGQSGDQSGANPPRPLDRLEFRARFDLAVEVVRQPEGGLVIAPRPIAVDSTPLRIRGQVGPSLYRSARAAGVPIRAIQQFLQTLDAHLSLDADIQPGDTFDIVVDFRRSANGETRVGDLLFAGLERAGKPQAQLLRWGSNARFFEASGIGQQRATLVSPVAGRVTSGFGMRRHPVLGYSRLHAGTDFGAPQGTPIYAVSDGTVSFSGRHGGHGNYVRLEHGGGIGSGYAHMSRIAVSSGEQVHTGQVIGYVGSTGLSTGPHLHWEVYRNGRTVDPMSVRFISRAQIDGAELAAFKARLAALKAITPGAALGGAAARPVHAPAAAAPREIDRLGP